MGPQGGSRGSRGLWLKNQKNVPGCMDFVQEVPVKQMAQGTPFGARRGLQEGEHCPRSADIAKSLFKTTTANVLATSADAA